MRPPAKPSPTEAPSLAEWLERATDTLARAEVPSPRVDAEWLAAHGLGIRWGSLWGGLREPVDPRTVRSLDALLHRRAGGEPLAYIFGSTVFFGRELACGPGVFVPRPETESLVEVALGMLDAEPRSRPTVVDVGTGSGAIAISIAAERPRARVWATECGEGALRYARANVARWAPGVRLVAGDLLDPLPASFRGRVDLLVSNPPYVPARYPERCSLDVGAEPPEAVFAGPEGDEALLRLAGEARSWIRPGGALVLEVGDIDQVRTVQACGGWEVSGFERDRAGHPRVVWARLPR